MKALVDAGAKVSIKAPDGTTVALAAAGSGNLDAMKYALELDPDLTAIGPDGTQHHALRHRQQESRHWRFRCCSISPTRAPSWT